MERGSDVRQPDEILDSRARAYTLTWMEVPATICPWWRKLLGLRPKKVVFPVRVHLWIKDDAIVDMDFPLDHPVFSVKLSEDTR